MKSKLAAYSVVVLFGVTSPATAESRHDRQVLGVLFGDESLANVLELRRQTAALPAAERFPLLLQAVFPEGREEIRVDIDFAPAHVSDVIADEYGLRTAWSTFPTSQQRDRIPPGGHLLAPAIDLVDTARELGRLEHVQQLVDQRTRADHRSRLALQILLDIGGDRFDSARDRLVEFYRLVSEAPVTEAERGPEAVVIWAASSRVETRLDAFDLVFLIYEQARNNSGPRSERWHRHVYSLMYLLGWTSQPQESKPPLEAAARWHPVSRTTAETNGRGFPVSRWEMSRGAVTNTTGHDRDYLYFASPLAGDFAVEADTSGFDYKDIRLGYGAVWAGPGYDHKGILNGNFRTDHPTRTLDPPLSQISEPMRVRLDVREGRRTTFINGRAVFESDVSPDDPWLSIFGYWYTHGWVRNLRISGDPVIPDEISLATVPALPGWLPYFDESAGSADADWQVVNSAELNSSASLDETGPVLLGRRQRQNAGAWQESLLRYHRPMFEDGVIEYEFYFQPGEFAAHPALDRLAFLLEPDGVSRHWITDGRFESTGQNPANREPLPNLADGGEALPLRADAWNHLQLQVTGDVASIVLNGEQVCRQRLGAANQRVFGLFHFADRTALRVRNLRWRGDWAKELPPVLDQQLADDTVEHLIAGPPLPDVFEFDFSAGLPADQFLVAGEGWQEQFQQHASGIRLRRDGAAGYDRYEIIPQLQLWGDFDVTARFADFAARTDAGGDANIQLFIGFDDTQETECRLYRKFSRYSDQQNGEQLMQAAHFETFEGRRNYGYPAKDTDESTTGRLRFVRRGDRLHYLYADNQSLNYRLLYSVDVPAGPTRPDHLRLIVETHKPGFAEVTWRSLTIQAEQISGLALQPSLSIAELDARRKSLARSTTINFADAAAGKFYRVWGTRPAIRFDEAGMQMNVPGADQWQGSGIGSRFGIAGDFDAALDLDVLKLETPGSGESTVYLEVELPGDPPPAIQAKYSISVRGIPTVEVQVRRRIPDGRFEYDEVVTVPSETIDQLRIARRGTVAYLIFRARPGAPSQILGRIEVGDAPLPVDRLRAIVHTGGAGRETVVRFRTLQVHAETIEAAP